MKKRIFALLTTLVLTLAFATTCFAKVSPDIEPITTKEPQVDKPKTSPKTGVDIAGAFVAIITASGVALTAKKKYSEAE